MGAWRELVMSSSSPCAVKFWWTRLLSVKEKSEEGGLAVRSGSGLQWEFFSFFFKHEWKLQEQMENKTCRRVSFGEGGRRKMKNQKFVFKPCFSVKKCVRKKALAVGEAKKKKPTVNPPMFLFWLSSCVCMCKKCHSKYRRVKNPVWSIKMTFSDFVRCTVDRKFMIKTGIIIDLYMTQPQKVVSLLEVWYKTPLVRNSDFIYVYITLCVRKKLFVQVKVGIFKLFYALSSVMSKCRCLLFIT